MQEGMDKEQAFHAVKASTDTMRPFSSTFPPLSCFSRPQTAGSVESCRRLLLACSLTPVLLPSFLARLRWLRRLERLSPTSSRREGAGRRSRLRALSGSYR